MKLIPVIDIKNGIAVHAKLGERTNYAPICSLLCPNCNVYSIIDAFLTLNEFEIIYLADLDAIMERGNNQRLIEKILKAYPQIMFWIDSGYLSSKSSILMKFDNYKAVLGSESYPEDKLAILKSFNKEFVLSLDFSKDNRPLGALKLFKDPSLWTKEVILMTLARVGSNAGADSNRFLDYQALAPKIEFVASGGIKNYKDCLELKKIGVKKALCATALHSKSISSAEIKKL